MKGNITMSNKEVNRVNVLEKLKCKSIKQKQAAYCLGLSVRQVRRLIKKYKRDGIYGLVHKLRGIPSHHRIDQKQINQAISMVKNHYVDFGPTLAHEKLLEKHRIIFSRETLRKAMIDVGIWKPKHRKYMVLHQMRERRSCEGELVLVDGSPHAWFEDRGNPCTLLVFIDDATGKLKHLEFAISESTNAYFMATQHYLKIHGKPIAFYLDKHGVFRINTSKQGTSSTSDSNGDTQFGRAMRELSIELIFANTPQAKGRVERVNQTLQDRLVKELRLRHINNLTDGNSYLSEFIAGFNRKFAVIPKLATNMHRPLFANENLDQILCHKHERVLSKQLTFQYENLLYQIKTSRPTYTMRYAKITVKEDVNSKVVLDYKGKLLDYMILKQQPKAEIIDSKHVNLAVDKIIKNQQQNHPNMKRVLSPDHPWRKPFFFGKNMASL